MSNNKTSIAVPIFLFFILGVVMINLDTITDYTASLIGTTPRVTVDDANKYASNNDYEYVQKTETFVPYSKHDLMNIFYSVLDNGYDSFTFYCPSEYTSCISDVNDITSNKTMITDIGNFVHPFNNFTNMEVITDASGEVNLSITKTYSNEQISAIEKEYQTIANKIFTDDMDINDKILAAHDYIINNTSYDLDSGANSGNAYGVFFEGKAKCAGYADAMAIVLSSLGIKNYKVASTEHVWNALYLDGTWYQIDLTWDDPIVENGTQITDTIRHKFYMIDTPTLYSYDTNEHSFDETVYRELKA